MAKPAQSMIQVHHLLGPAILIYYGTGKDYASLAISESSHPKAAQVWVACTRSR